MNSESLLQKEIKLSNEELEQLALFFDELAYFDYEDSKKTELEASSGIVVSAPKVSELGSNLSK